MKLVLALIATLTSVNAFAWGTQRVHGYTRNDGTYVSPYLRSTPDGNPYNNLGRGYNSGYQPQSRGMGYGTYNLGNSDSE